MTRLPVIILVDDEPIDRWVISRALVASGCVERIKEAQNGEQAVTVLEELEAEGETDIIILSDINMPRMNGFELVGNLRATGYSHPVYLLSSSSAQADADRAHACGANGFLRKESAATHLFDALAQLRGRLH